MLTYFQIWGSILPKLNVYFYNIFNSVPDSWVSKNLNHTIKVLCLQQSKEVRPRIHLGPTMVSEFSHVKGVGSGCDTFWVCASYIIYEKFPDFIFDDFLCCTWCFPFYDEFWCKKDMCELTTKWWIMSHFHKVFLLLHVAMVFFVFYEGV